MNNELFRRLQKAASKASAQVESEDTTAMKRLNQMQREIVAKDVAELLNEFVTGLKLVERSDG